MCPDQHYHIFLSHNHADKPAVAEIARRLVEAGLHPWFAASHLIPGEPWQEAMEAALVASDTVAVFVGAQGMGPWHNEQMRVALEDAVYKGKRVIPVLLPGADPERISPFLKRRTWVDFRVDLGDAAAFQSLLAGVRGETPFEAAGLFGFAWRRRHDFYRHIPLPPHIIPRPELLAEVRGRLLAGTGNLALTSAIQVRQADVLHGMGGIGKSVLARALCDDPDVQAAFPDGILWATLGQTPDLTARLREWIETLGGIVGQTAPTLDQLRNTLAEELRDKACLLVVDDAWRKAHLEPFCAGGPRCRLLITTRDAALAEGLDAEVYPVPVMAANQAIALLEEWAQGNLAEVETVAKARIVKRLGCLPLAVRLAGAQLRAKDPAEWLASFDARRLKSRRVETVHDSLEATFALSLDALTPADRRLYMALAIFKEDEPAPVVAIARLWSALDGRDSDETDELLDGLADRTLLARSRSDGDSVTLHDLLRDFMAAELGEQGRIAAHRALLAAYRQTQQGYGWHTAPDDAYLYHHLAYHLYQLADHDPTAESDLRGLFENHAWLHARVPRSGYLYDGYLSDLHLAWRRVHITVCHQINTDQEPSALAISMRYALIHTTFNSLAESYVPELVARAVETGLWVPERALSVGRLIPEPGNAAAYWGMLLSTESLSFEQCQLVERKGLAATQAIDDDWLRGCTLAKLAPHLTSTSLHEAVAIAETIGNEQHRTEALAALQLNLADTPELQSQRGPDPVQGSQDKKTPEWVVLCQGSPVKDEGQEAVLREEFQTALAHKDRESRVEALAALAPRLMGELLQKGLAAANAIDDQWICAYPIAALTSQLADVTQEPVLHAGLAMALAIHDDDARWIALKTLAPLLKGTLLKHGLAAALAIEDYEGYRARVLAAMVPQLVGEEREQVLREGLASAQATQDEQRGDALATLAPYLTGELLQQGLALANTIANDLSRAEALAALASQLTGATREAVLHEVITGVLASEDWEFQARALVALAPQLAAEDCEVMLRVTLEINDGCCRADALTALAPRLAGGLLQKGLAAALAIDDEESRIRALAALIPQLMDGDREEALRAGLAATQLISKDYIRADALAALAPHLIDELLQEGLAATQVIEGDWSRAHALAALAPHLTDELLQEGLAATQVIEGDWSRAHALAAFLPVISNSEALIRSIRQAVADYLWTASEGLERELIAQFCADRDLFTPPILSPDTLAAIAGHIIEICQEWEWL